MARPHATDLGLVANVLSVFQTWLAWWQDPAGSTASCVIFAVSRVLCCQGSEAPGLQAIETGASRTLRHGGGAACSALAAKVVWDSRRPWRSQQAHGPLSSCSPALLRNLTRKSTHVLACDKSIRQPEKLRSSNSMPLGRSSR